MSTKKLAILQEQLKANTKRFAVTLPVAMQDADNKTLNQFKASLMVAVDKTPKILDCTPESVMISFLTCLQLGLMPNTPQGHAYLIPYGSNVTMQIGYRGLIELAYRSGIVKSLSAENVYSNDEFDFSMGTDRYLKHKMSLSNRGNYMATYAVAVLNSDEKIFTIINQEEMNYIRDTTVQKDKTGKIPSVSPWNNWEDEMRKKTALKRLIKTLPTTNEVAVAMQVDNDYEQGKVKGMKKNDGKFDYMRDAIVEDGEIQEENSKEKETIDAVKKAVAKAKKI